MRNSIMLGIKVNRLIPLLGISLISFISFSCNANASPSVSKLTPSQRNYLQGELASAKNFSSDPKSFKAKFEGIDATTAKCVESDMQITPIFASPGKGVATFEISCGKRVTYKLRIESVGKQKIYHAYILAAKK
jgi:hypothetical protein